MTSACRLEPGISRMGDCSTEGNDLFPSLRLVPLPKIGFSLENTDGRPKVALEIAQKRGEVRSEFARGDDLRDGLGVTKGRKIAGIKRRVDQLAKCSKCVVVAELGEVIERHSA